ncbi:unnamed protein product [Brassica oleracea var. botrytis]
METWRKMKSFGHKSSSITASITKSKSWNGSAHLENANNKESTGNIKKKSPPPPPPHGCFTVYVGPTKQRVVVKTKLLNHPLFKNLLEEAEAEYGYRRDGPIVLPCEVDFFYKVLANMKFNGDEYDEEEEDDDGMINPPICGLGSPYRCAGLDSMGVRRSGSYKLLRSPSLFKLNRF